MPGEALENGEWVREAASAYAKKDKQAKGSFDYLLLIIDYFMATYNHYYELPVYKSCRAFRKKISALARKIFSKNRRILIESTGF